MKKKNVDIDVGEKIRDIQINREIFIKKQIILYAILLLALSTITISVMLIFNNEILIIVGIFIIAVFAGLCMLSIYKYTKKISYTLYTKAIVAQFDTLVEKISLSNLVDAKIYSSFLSKAFKYNTKRVVLYFYNSNQSKLTLYSITEDAENLVKEIKSLASNLRKNDDAN